MNLDIKIENVVVSAALDVNINLSAVSEKFRITQYDPERFPGLVFRFKRPHTTILLFSSGKMVCTGGSSDREAKSGVLKVVEELNRAGIKAPVPDIFIRNIVASANLNRNVDLETAADILGNVMYEPEQFPGMIFRLKRPKTVLLVFASGKVVCTGGTNEKVVREAVEKLYETLEDNLLLL